MKKLFFALIILVLSFLSQATFAQSSSWTIPNFESKIRINSDSSILVQEEIETFFYVQKHGIYRNIPLSYKDRYGNNFKLRFNLISVTDESGRSLKYQLSRSGGEAKIKIGDPDLLVTGRQVYMISYQVQRAVTYFTDHDELYWNATGTSWEVPIKNSKAEIILPKTIDESDIKTQCYTGSYGSREEDCTSSFSDNKAEFSGQGYLTVVFGWPKNITTKPSFINNLGWFISDNWMIFIPIIVFLSLLYIWYKNGRDPVGRKTIVPQYEPPDKSLPAIVGVLIDEKVDIKDVSATVIDLAVQGYLKIKEEGEKGLVIKKKDYSFIQLKDFKADKDISFYEKKILEGIFGDKKEVRLSDLKNDFYQNLNEIKGFLYEDSVKAGYFAKRPDKIRGFYLICGIVVSVLGGILISFFEMALVPVISILASGGIIIIFSFFMPKRTQKGVGSYEYALGFKLYLEKAEKYRLKFAEKENLFEKYLPYAMIFGVADKWAKAFADIYKNPPSWYEGYGPGQFNAIVFASSLNNFSESTNSTFVSTPSGGGSGFGGGGFSGGGFGGGGGGSW